MNYIDRFSLDGMNCVQQKSLLKIWERLKNGKGVPSFDALPLDDLKRSLDKMMYCNIERSNGGIRFMIAFHGDQFTRMYGKECIGSYLDETIPPAMRSDALRSYVVTATTAEPSFNIVRIRNGDGPVINYERLLLPFSVKGPTVSRIVCMITLFSEANGFDSRDVTADKLTRV